MFLLTPVRPSRLSSFAGKLFGSRSATKSELIHVEEHEVYLAGLWDSSTSHSPVEFTGTREECEAWLADSANVRQNCRNWKQSIRPTGKLLERLVS